MKYKEIEEKFHDKYPNYVVNDYRPTGDENSIILWTNNGIIRVKYHDDLDIFELLDATNQ